MQWLGLTADEGPVFQTDRFYRYNEVIDVLVEQGDAYPCYCSRERLDALREEQMASKQKPRYDGHCRDRTDRPDGVTSVIRFKNPQDGVVEFNDVVRGVIKVANNELDDLIIRRSDETPTYNLTVVVDDADMNITQVIRGDDHINNTPRQINLYRALNWDIPSFAHIPMILGEDGARLSKRHGAVGVMEYQKKGYLPEALLNYLVRLGWSYGDEEVFSVDELIEKFSIDDVNRSPSSFSVDKLNWINQHYIKNTDSATLAPLLEEQLTLRGLDCGAGPSLELAIEAYRERAQTLVDMATSMSYLYVDEITLDPAAAKKHLRPVALGPLVELQEQLNDLDSWSVEVLSATVESVLNKLELKMPKLAQPLRVALTGAAMSPSIDVTLELVGKERTLRRIELACDFMRARESDSRSRAV